MLKDKDKKEKKEEVPVVDLPVAEICAHLRDREGSVGEDLRFVRYIIENEPMAVRYFMDEFSVPILRYIANNVLCMEDDSEYGKEPYVQLVGAYYLFIGEPFELSEGSKSEKPRWYKLSLYKGEGKARLYTYVFRIALRYFCRNEDDFVNKEKNAGELLENVDYEVLLGCDLVDEEMSDEEIAALRRAHKAFDLLREKDQEVLRVMVMEKTHWSKAFDLLRKYLDPLGPKKAWQSWSFEEKQAAIDQYWTPKQKQDAISLLKIRAISHLTERYNELKRKEHEKKQ